MSQIYGSIAKECPGGVRYRTVKDATNVVTTARGVKREDYARGSKIPIVDQGQRRIAGYTDDDSIALPADRYIVFGDHTRIVKWIDFAFAPGADGTKVLRAADGVDLRYLYHALSALQIPSRGYNRHWTVLRDLRIPVPPVKVQREIVRVLDLFTELEAELEAELGARQIQNAFYRNSLLTFGSEVPRVPMGNLGEFVRGRRFTKDDVVDDGIPAIHYGEIYTHYGVATKSTLSHVRSDLADELRYAQPGDVVIAAVGETVEDVAKAVAWLGDEPAAIHDDTFLFRSKLNPKFVSYFMQTADFHRQKNKYVARAKVKRLSGESLAKVTIPVPQPEEQERVVEILDKFDALVNDTSIGLPAELNARCKQYEHYRDRLLTFEELAA